MSVVESHGGILQPWGWENITEAEDDGRADYKGKAVVVMTGALAPMHRGHGGMLQAAADRLTELNYQVVR